MSAFSCFLPKTLFGDGSLSAVGEVSSRYGLKAMLCIDPYLDSHGITDKVISLLKSEGIAAVVNTEITPNPDCLKVDAAGRQARDERCDLVVAVGGGSALDFGKGVAVVAKNDGAAWDFTERSDHTIRRPGPVLPVVAVPTTAGTGSEATPFAVLNNPEIREKSTIVSDAIMPAAALADPSLTHTLPPELTALTGVDALAHAAEAYMSTKSNAYVEMVALEAMRIVGRYLPVAVADGANSEAREKMLWASYLGGSAIAYIGVTLPHAMGQPAGGLKGMPHGASVAACLARVIEFSWESSPEKFANIAAALDPAVRTLPPAKQAEQCSSVVSELIERVGVGARYRDYGITEADIDSLTEIALTGYYFDIQCHPKQVTRDEIRALYRQCL